MKGNTHLAAAAMVAVIANVDASSMALAVFGSLLPDIDCEMSKLGRHVKWFSSRVKHRTMFHSAILAVGAYLLHPWLGIGVISHIILDILNPKGVQLFWPIRGMVRLSNSTHLRSGSIFEKVLFTLMLLITTAFIIFPSELHGFVDSVMNTITGWFN